MNGFGRIFRASLWGESHGPVLGVLLDGCPAGVPLSPEDFLPDLGRRRSGAPGTTKRKEDDWPLIQSGVYEGKTTGAPILIEFANRDVDSSAYLSLKDTPRPGHADWVAHYKYKGFNDVRGGGHFSGRLTLGLVAAGVVAKKMITPAGVQARILEIGGHRDWRSLLEQAASEGDSLGGVIECRASGVPAGLGEPFFDSAESLLSHAVFAIPGIKGIEFGSGFGAARMKGSRHNDEILDPEGRTRTNHAGGINGGITNGNELLFRVAVKPTSSIAKAQSTVDLKTGEPAEIVVRGRHDACIALRAPVVLEAVTALVLADLLLLSRSQGFYQERNA